MGKVLQFKPRRPSPKLVPPRGQKTACPQCGHRADVHITHPNGAMSCAARGCTCHTPPSA